MQWGQETIGKSYISEHDVNCVFYYLHSHWLCSTKGSSMSSCFMKEVLISFTQIRKHVMLNCEHPLTVFINHLLCYTEAGLGLECVCASIPPWWACVWAREHTPGPRQNSSRHIASPTRRTGQKDGASPPATPAKPPPECPEAHSRSANKPPTTAALVEKAETQTNQYSPHPINHLHEVVQDSL